MANLPAIIKATRASAAALASMSKHERAQRDALRAHDMDARARALRAYRAARTRYENAQAVLFTNPL